MPINVKQLREYVIHPALEAINACSESAIQLLLGTAAQETLMGSYLHQINGPALGIYQMEPATYYDIFDKVINPNPNLLLNINKLIGWGYEYEPPKSMLIQNLAFATVLTRCHYLRFKEPLPKVNDIEGMARYYKKYYNTPKGKATESSFIDHYRRFVL